MAKMVNFRVWDFYRNKKRTKENALALMTEYSKVRRLDLGLKQHYQNRISQISLNWLNFNIAVSRGLRRPKERERDGKTMGLWSSHNTDIYRLSLRSYLGTVPGAPEQLESQLHRPLITDHHDKYNNNENVWCIASVTKRWHEVNKCCWKNGAYRFAWHEVATNLQFVYEKHK